METNKRIKAILENYLNNCNDYLSKCSFRESVIEYCKQFMLDEVFVGSLELNEIEKRDFTDELLSIADRRDVVKGIQKVLDNFKKLNSSKIVKKYIRELKVGLEKEQDVHEVGKAQCFSLVINVGNTKASLNAWGEKLYPVSEYPGNILDIVDDNFKFYIHEVVDYAPVMGILNAEWYQEIYWEFDGEPQYFKVIEEMYLTYNYLCLHEAFLSGELSKPLQKLPTIYPLYIFGNEHDSGKSAINIAVLS